MYLISFKVGYYLTTRDNKKDKLKLIFDMYDSDGNGYLDQYELRQALIAMSQLNKIEHNPEINIEVLFKSYFKQLDVNKDGRISKSIPKES